MPKRVLAPKKRGRGYPPIFFNQSSHHFRHF
jgi:hypothetical protein